MRASGMAAAEGSRTRAWMDAWAKAAKGRNTKATRRRMNEFTITGTQQVGREAWSKPQAGSTACSRATFTNSGRMTRIRKQFLVARPQWPVKWLYTGQCFIGVVRFEE